jgi:hypothetical protein
MQACSLLLGRPWEFDTDAIHYGRSNKYTIMHNGKKITLLPLTPNEIVQCDRTIAETARQEKKPLSCRPQMSTGVQEPRLLGGCGGYNQS